MGHAYPRGEAQKARAALQSIYDRYLRHICGVKYATPSAMLLEELGLAPLQVFWWRRTLEFWNKIATSPVGSLFHTVLLDNLDDAFSVANGGSIVISLSLSLAQSRMINGRGHTNARFLILYPFHLGTGKNILRVHNTEFC